MKFGDTLYQRSVPKWAAYNVKYNELKHLIKTRTSAGAVVPVDIPSAGRSRWEELENRLFKLLEAEYDNVTLFIRSKQGEIERRLAHLEKQIKIAQRAVEENALDKPILHARKYRQMLRDIEDIGDEIQNLARFAAVQKTAFRKILKKYRKWTGSTALQTRLDVEVFSSNKLQTNFSDHLQQLAEDKTILTEELAGPMLTGRVRERSADRQQKRISASEKRSPIAQITEALLRGPLAFDAAVLAVPYGEASGSAFYWIHPDNLDEARTLLLRHMRDSSVPATPSRRNSEEAIVVRKRAASSSQPNPGLIHQAVFDNAYRFVKDSSHSRPSRIALSAYWSYERDAVVTLAGLSPMSSGGVLLTLNRHDLARALQRDSAAANASKEVNAVQNYLVEHRDVKPLAEVCTHRSRYVGITNTGDVANWATLDTGVTVAPVDMTQLGEPSHDFLMGDAFPYSILYIRWEFARTPAVVRAFDESHLVEKIPGFALEDMAIRTVQKDLPPPAWQPLLEKDIRKVPLVSRLQRPGTTNRTRLNMMDVRGTSSGPSSSDGPSDSVFSTGTIGHSSATSEGGGPDPADGSPHLSKTAALHSARRKKRARIQVPERLPAPVRYWNEFDDGDSDVNPDEGYVIYVDPNEAAFPGSEAISKAFGVVYDSLSNGTSKVLAWLPLPLTAKGSSDERAPLLGGSSAGEAESSDSETDSMAVPGRVQPPSSRRIFQQPPKGPGYSTYRPQQLLSLRQKMLERTLFWFYCGLIGISYVLLIMAGILLGAGRRKAFVEVDAGVVAGVVCAETCAVAAMILIMMRKQRLSVIHWGLVGVLVASVMVVGVALLALVFAGGHPATHRKGHPSIGT